MKKEIRLEFDAISENEGLARVVVAAFLTQLDPTLEEVQDVDVYKRQLLQQQDLRLCWVIPQ